MKLEHDKAKEMIMKNNTHDNFTIYRIKDNFEPIKVLEITREL